MPLLVIAWLANVAFVVIPVMLSFLAVSFIANPPSSVADALLESHKVILVGAITLSGVALIEAILLAQKLAVPRSRDYVKFCVIGGLTLISALIFGVTFYLVALVNGGGASHEMSLLLLLQCVLGVSILAISVIVAARLKYIEARVLDIEAAIAGKKGTVP